MKENRPGFVVGLIAIILTLPFAVLGIVGWLWLCALALEILFSGPRP